MKKYYFPNEEYSDMVFGGNDAICIDKKEIERLSKEWEVPDLFSQFHEASEEEIAIYGRYDS